MKLLKRKNKKLFIISVAAASLLLAGGVGYTLMHKTPGNENTRPGSGQANSPRPVNSVDYSAPSDSDKKAQDAQKDQIIKQQGQNSGTPTNSNLSVSISRASQAGAGQALNIRTIITGLTSGICQVTLTQPGQTTISKSYNISYQATYAACQEADIPASDFPVGSDWTLQIVAKNDSSQSPPASQTVSIKK